MDYMASERPSWPAAAVCRIVPLVLVAVGIIVPATRWSSLPHSRPGLLLLPIILGGIAAIGLLPLAWRPRGWAERSYDGPAYTAGISGITLGWLKAKFGPESAGLFVLASSTGLALAITVGSVGSSKWHLPWPGILSSFAGAVLIAVLGGEVVRSFGRLMDSRTLKPWQQPIPSSPDYDEQWLP